MDGKTREHTAWSRLRRDCAPTDLVSTISSRDLSSTMMASRCADKAIESRMSNLSKRYSMWFSPCPWNTNKTRDYTDGTWRLTCKAARNRVNNCFWIDPWLRIRSTTSHSCHLFNVSVNFPNKLLITLENTKKKEKVKNIRCVTGGKHVVCKDIYN